ncbi:MAG TPA: FecR domain-containing protein [Oleiagrimonas sp.]|nr:FecR domain-containing protein [Oleiagrimonas sp.]
MSMEAQYTAKGSRADVPDTAEQWLARLLDPDCTDADRDAFERWRAASPAHASAYAQAERIWNLSAQAIDTDPALAAAAQRALQPSRPRQPLYRWGAATLAVAALLVVALLVVPTWLSPPNAPTGTVYRTAIGQQRTIPLSDGSSILLDTHSVVRVRYSDRARRVDLMRGRAQFSVHGDPHWPFVVHAYNGTVTALGTRFQVALDGDKVDVTLLHGQLAIATRVDDTVRRAALTSGQRLHFDRTGSIGPVHPADMTQARGWTAGKLFVHDWRLPRLLAAMNRYSTTQVVIGDASLKTLRISGVFHVGDQRTLVQALEEGWPVKATNASGDRVVLARK